MKIYELNRAQMDALKESMMTERVGNPSYGELLDSHESISDQEVYDEFGGTEFTGDDFGASRELYFGAGYHEWNLWINNEVAWSTGDPAEALEDMPLADLVAELAEKAKEKLDLSGEELEELKTQMESQWYSHYFGEVA